MVEMKEPPHQESDIVEVDNIRARGEAKPKHVYSTCYTGGVLYLKKGDFLYVKDYYGDHKDGVDRYIEMSAAASFWGVYAIRWYPICS